MTKGIEAGKRNQVLLGVTGSGKTYSIANVIQNTQKPTLVISHNKTLAAQLYQEFRDFFPDNAVSYFVSYYDYYQPEAYMPTSDTYIEKEAQINDEIDKLRLSATTNLLTRDDVIVVSSVSCIYNLGSPVEYSKFILSLVPGMKVAQRDILVRLSDLQYSRNDYEFKRGTYRLRGGTIELLPAYMDTGIRIDMTGDIISSIKEFDPLTGDTVQVMDRAVIYPAKHYMTDPATYENAFKRITEDAEKQVAHLKSQNRLIEAQRIQQRTKFDLEMIKEVGYVNGIENYSIYFDGRKAGDPPYTLIDYFDHKGKDWLLIIDESHITLPQVRGMYTGDRSRKETLIDYGFRLPSALDNRPLKFEEFQRHIKQAIYVSATPDEYELSLATEEDGIVEQLIRPTGIVDPTVSVRPTEGQIKDLLLEIEKRVVKKERILVTTLTKRMSEELTTYLEEKGIKVTYLHSDIDTLARQDILDQLRRGDVDVLVGINLLREGLDLPEVTLVAILDADKEGFLRSRSSLIQTMGRAARNVNSEVIMYADHKTKSMEAAIGEVERRRVTQLAYNKKHGITPINIEKSIRARLTQEQEKKDDRSLPIDVLIQMGKKEVLLPDEREDLIKKLRKEMKDAASKLDFETATLIRDEIRALEIN